MSNDAWKEWEEYNLGLQGTPTGSLENQIGLDDRPKSYTAEDYQRPKKLTSKPEKSQKQKKIVKLHDVSNSNSKGLGLLVGGIVGVAVFLLLVEKIGNESVFTYLLTATAVAFGYRFYKAILGMAVAVAVIYFLNQQ